MKNRNYLRIYANLGKETYTEAEKELLVKSFVAIGEEIFGEKHLRFDINGSGYGISKGDPLVMAKTFWSKIDKKGYKNFEGMSAHSKDEKFESQFSLILKLQNFSRFEAEFFWNGNTTYDNEKALQVVIFFQEMIVINYCYGYLADKNLTWNEWVVKKSFFSTSSYIPKTEKIWAGQIGDIPQGQIKKLYDFNVFNSKQIEKLDPTIAPTSKIPLSNGLEVWTF